MLVDFLEKDYKVALYPKRITVDGVELEFYDCQYRVSNSNRTASHLYIYFKDPKRYFEMWDKYLLQLDLIDGITIICKGYVTANEQTRDLGQRVGFRVGR